MDFRLLPKDLITDFRALSRNRINLSAHDLRAAAEILHKTHNLEDVSIADLTQALTDLDRHRIDAMSRLRKKTQADYDAAQNSSPMYLAMSLLQKAAQAKPQMPIFADV